MGEPGLATLGGEKLKLCEWGILFGLGKSCGETAADKSVSGGKRVTGREGKGRGSDGGPSSERWLVVATYPKRSI